ncbi:hypothetical protein AMELA_G00235970 [Ameiurus melas]|uniref:Uncharacterized protein n=1 Tax=Ameiurus melas TaxID=219545 RepID=A0A7J6A278_AMEME|nr:hypothetical protein AMELA_G00235970 [Ameiurus melas]
MYCSEPMSPPDAHIRKVKENAGYERLTVGALQIQCYQCEEIRQDDCSSPEFIVNCTVNVQDMCQKEVLIREDGVHYRKSCASSGACLIASSGHGSLRQKLCWGP